MGRFAYDAIVSIDFEDRLLAHLQVVIGAKIRRGESFHFSWKDDPSTGRGRTIVWVHPRCPIVFKFYGSGRPRINRAWVEALTIAADSPGGLHLVPEPPEHPVVDSGHHRYIGSPQPPSRTSRR
ncbi:hypothetical protein ACPW96_18700 [Micromonospora sp. DT81.3]|uniref:DUF7882 family protein n=1 Tax=Micromonospora sp. DT81.3 TaxID=3416523 RepID=UPI003CF9FF37